MCETVKMNLFYELNSDCCALYETGGRIKSFKMYRASALFSYLNTTCPIFVQLHIISREGANSQTCKVLLERTT